MENERRRIEDTHYEKILERFTVLENRFSELNAKFDVYIAKQSAMCDNHRKETEMLILKNGSLSHIINGNGEQGMADKVRNLEKIDDIHAKNYYVIYSALIVLIVGALWKLVIR